MLPLLHERGYRLLLLEAASPELCEWANRERVLPEHLRIGYMRDSVLADMAQSALDLGWNIGGYDDQLGQEAEYLAWFSEPPGGLHRTPRYAKFREQVQAQNIVALWTSHERPKTFIWCGNGHGARASFLIPKGALGAERDYRVELMGQALWKRAGVKPYTVTQNLTVEWPGEGIGARGRSLLNKYEKALKSSSDLLVIPASSISSDYARKYDAVILSSDNKFSDGEGATRP